MTSSSDAWVVERALKVARSSAGELLAIVGPTASGKTELAVALAQRIGGEVVSADSVQIYRSFDIGSGKPSLEQLAVARHHLVGALDPLAPIDAASWAERAGRILEDVRARGAVPIVCGGSFLWIRALLFGLAHAPGASTAVRASHEIIRDQEGRPALHERLQRVDPQSAARLHPNDYIRVSRALEVYELTGRPMSQWQGEHGFAQPRYQGRLLALTCDPATLSERIEARVDVWLARGWVDEVRSLLAHGYGGARPMGSVGYAQVRDMLAGSLPSQELASAIARATKRFARKQRTWLKHADVNWI
jgi:tRNA dimethylallyltransferase